MKTEIVFSPIKDKNIKKDIINSPIWKECYKPEELSDEMRGKMTAYTIKFDGLTPVQVTNINHNV